MKCNTNQAMRTGVWGQRRGKPCLLVPYLIQFTEVSKCRIAPVGRKVSSVGWKHAKHLLRMDSESSTKWRRSPQHFTLSPRWLLSSDGTRSRCLRRCWQRVRLQCLDPHTLRWCQSLRRYRGAPQGYGSGPRSSCLLAVDAEAETAPRTPAHLSHRWRYS